MFSISQQLTVADESNGDSFGEFSRLVEKTDFGKGESVALTSLPSGYILKQDPESVPLASRENVPLQEERIKVGVDHTRYQTIFHEYLLW